MYAYKLTIAYDGTDYHGWQEQEVGLPTITSTLRRTFAHAFEQPLEFLVGASRTDAGVHALGQVARIKIPFTISAHDLQVVWNRILPSSIMLTDVQSVDELFHPQHNVQRKTYWYHLFIERPLPFTARYGWFYDTPLDYKALEDALMLFVGTHDFRSFTTGHDHASTIRTITNIQLIHVPEYNAYRIIVEGPSFLRYMIRRIVGACVNVATSRKYSLSFLQQALAACNPRQDLLTAPAHGLVLHAITYQ